MFWNNLKCLKHSEMIEKHFEQVITSFNLLKQMFEEDRGGQQVDSIHRLRC